jgi:hypothetical protein
LPNLPTEVENADYVLCHKTDNRLYIKLTVNRGKKQWEATENFFEAKTFNNFHEAERTCAEHRCPRNLVRLRPYESALSDFHQRVPPHQPVGEKVKE